MAGGRGAEEASVGVVVPARNAASTLPVQLAALAAQDYVGRWDLVIADNGSTDGTAELVEQWRLRVPWLRRVSVPEAGANRARNAGVRASAGECILICDADDEVSPGWVRSMAAALEHDDIVGGPLEYERLSPPGVPRPPAHATTELPQVFGHPYVITANIGFRRFAFDTIGGFDETFGVGGDDVDFSWRAQRSGLSLGFVPDALVHYRLRGPMRAFYRQQYGYSKGGSHLYAKYRASELLPPRPLRRQLVAAGGDVLEVLRTLPQLGDPAKRWFAVQECARLAGGIAGALRWGVYPP